jgi:hypothetical protein
VEAKRVSPAFLRDERGVHAWKVIAMHSLRPLTVFFLVCLPLLGACVPLRKVAPTLPALRLAQEEARQCQRARVVFPAGDYRAEVESERGVFYAAPGEVRVEGVLIGGGERGGLFVARDGRHAAWFGDARESANERPQTFLDAVGASSPKLWLLDEQLPVTPVSATKH